MEWKKKKNAYPHFFQAEKLSENLNAQSCKMKKISKFKRIKYLLFSQISPDNHKAIHN